MVAPGGKATGKFKYLRFILGDREWQMFFLKCISICTANVTSWRSLITGWLNIDGLGWFRLELPLLSIMNFISAMYVDTLLFLQSGRYPILEF